MVLGEAKPKSNPRAYTFLAIIRCLSWNPVNHTSERNFLICKTSESVTHPCTQRTHTNVLAGMFAVGNKVHLKPSQPNRLHLFRLNESAKMHSSCRFVEAKKLYFSTVQYCTFSCPLIAQESHWNRTASGLEEGE